MKVLITGSTGMLGSNLLRFLPYNTIGFSSTELDITNIQTCFQVLDNIQPNVIIHAAAYTNVEDCEIDPNKAFLINTIGTQNLVNWSLNKEVLFIYISSTGIYGNHKTNEPYNEFDTVSPTTIHHKSKYEGEKSVQNHLKKFLILRTGWLFGGDKELNKNFVYKRFLEAKSSQKIFSDVSQIGNPTYIVDLITQIEILIKNNCYGIFNCINRADNISRFDYVKKIIEYSKLNCAVEIAPQNMFKRVAPVSNNESAINYKLNLMGINMMGDWDKALRKYIDNLL